MKLFSYVFIILLIFLPINDANGQKVLNVMSYNIRHGTDMNDKDQLTNLGKYIKESGVDIVGLQEVDSICWRSGRVDQTKMLGEITGMYSCYVRHFAFEGGSYGLALLSKYPILKIHNYRIPIISEEENDTRAFLIVELSIGPQKKMVVGNVHLDYRNPDSRIKQAQLILKLMRQQDCSSILLGDMNATPDSKEIQMLSQDFKDIELKDIVTFPTDSPKKKIDYIFISKDQKIKVLNVESPGVQYSDHRPMIATVDFY